MAYADDVNILARSNVDAQSLLSQFCSYLEWTKCLRAKHEKCIVVGWKYNPNTRKYEPFAPTITLGQFPLPVQTSKAIRLLGRNFSISLSSDEIPSALTESIETHLKKIDALQLRNSYKLVLYRMLLRFLCRWDLTVNPLNTTWAEELTSTCVKYLKRWSHLRISAHNSVLFLPPSKCGLGLPNPSVLTRQCHLTKAMTLFCSKDPVIKALFTSQTAHEKELIAKATTCPRWYASAKLAQLIAESSFATCTNLSVPQRGILMKQFTEEEEAKMSEVFQSLPVQGHMARSTTSPNYPDEVLWMSHFYGLGASTVSFAVNAMVDTLPTGRNLQRWWPNKHLDTRCTLCGHDVPTLQHYLCSCPVVLNQGRSRYRHNQVLKVLYEAVVKDCDVQILVDLPDCPHSYHVIPSDVVLSQMRPDLILLRRDSNLVIFVELTVPMEENIHARSKDKHLKYVDLVASVKPPWKPALHTIEIGARGHVGDNAIFLLTLLFSRRLGHKIARRMSEAAVQASHVIWLHRKSPSSGPWIATQDP